MITSQIDKNWSTSEEEGGGWLTSEEGGGAIEKVSRFQEVKPPKAPDFFGFLWK